jgi:hypothetical protein
MYSCDENPRGTLPLFHRSILPCSILLISIIAMYCVPYTNSVPCISFSFITRLSVSVPSQKKRDRHRTENPEDTIGFTDWSAFNNINPGRRTSGMENGLALCVASIKHVPPDCRRRSSSSVSSSAFRVLVCYRYRMGGTRSVPLVGIDEAKHRRREKERRE